MTIQLSASDTLFFRDAKPFKMGDDSVAESVFPPSPSVFYGALRTAYISENPIYENAIADSEAIGIKGIFFLKDNNICFPIPLDLFKYKNNKKEKPLNFFKPQEKRLQETEIVSNTYNIYLLDAKSNEENAKIENGSGLILSENFEEYLKGNDTDEKEIYYLEGDSFLISEPKIGIGIDSNTGTSEESKLYKIAMQRLRNIDFLIDFEGQVLNGNSQFVRLGGEGKTVRIKETNIAVPSMPTDIGNHFKIYLSTPAVFKNGWLPNWITDNENLTGELDGVQLQITSAAIGKYLSIGGFDMVKRIPKKMYRAVPAGSVYYIKVLNPQPEFDLFNFLNNNFHYKSISDLQEHQKQGFGIAFIGKI